MKPIITTITDDWITQHNPCPEAIEWWDKKERNPFKILELLIKDKKYDWANWFIVRLMAYKDYVSYAVYAAEQVIDIFEKQYPNDKRPRKAIEAAKKCIDNPTKENRVVAHVATDAAAHAVYATAHVAQTAAYAAAHKAHAVAHAVAQTVAHAARATDAAAHAAHAAAQTAAYAAAYAAAETAAHVAQTVAHAAQTAMQLKILKYGMELLKVKMLKDDVEKEKGERK